MPLPYSYVTLATARSQIAQRLYDPNMVFYTSSEITMNIQEALQTWNAMSQFWRGDFTFPTTQNTWFDLTQVANTLRPYATTDQDIYISMENSLLEPVTLNWPTTGSVWTGTAMFGISDFVQAVQRRMNEILGVTGCTITQSMLATTPGTVRNFVNDFVIGIRRIAWFPTSATNLVTGNTISGSNTVFAVSNTTGITIGQTVTGSGIPASTTVTSTTINAITLSNAATATALNVTLTITPPASNPVLWPEDVWAFQAYEPDYGVAPQGSPSSYAISAEPPLSFDVDVPPDVASQYELLTVNAGPVLTPSAPTLIPIPTDFTWILKWGALADLLSKEAEAKDQTRSTYCNKRYEQGLQLLQIAPAVLQLRVNGVPVWIDAVRSADEFNTTWQSETPGQPTACYIAGTNLIALSPQPDATGYSITATVTMNAPLPVNDNDMLQIPRDSYDVLIDYVQHICLFKNGGAEFTETMEQLNRMIKNAANYNSRLGELGAFQEAIFGQSQREETMNPRYTRSYLEGPLGSNTQSGGQQTPSQS